MAPTAISKADVSDSPRARRPDHAGGSRESRRWRTNVDQAYYAIRSMEERIGDTQWQFQITHTLLASFALLALVLAIATVGVYGVISHAVNLRVREFGICMAMGGDARGRDASS